MFGYQEVIYAFWVQTGVKEPVLDDTIKIFSTTEMYVPADFDTNRKSLLRRRSAEKGLKYVIDDSFVAMLPSLGKS